MAADLSDLRRKLPGWTCPSIDSAIRTLHASELEPGEVRDIESELEDLRSENSKLREVAEAALDAGDALETRVAELEEKVSELEGLLDEASAVCHHHGDELDADQDREEGEGPVLRVRPCSRCEEDAFQRGRSEGFQAGKDRGYREGLEAGRSESSWRGAW